MFSSRRVQLAKLTDERIHGLCGCVPVIIEAVVQGRHRNDEKRHCQGPIEVLEDAIVLGMKHFGALQTQSDVKFISWNPSSCRNALIIRTSHKLNWLARPCDFSIQMPMPDNKE